jgi:6-hydroxycyclohex-1-ene-1-carbonyl-CoA dehydrogenase
MAFWTLSEKGKAMQRLPELPFQEREGWTRVKVAGCGLCHTDLGFIYTEVPTRHPLPLVLGHEIAGTVMEGPLAGRQVVVPAVIACGECAPCKAGLPRICSRQLMPGNDIHGGFGPWIQVPERALIPLPREVDATTLARLSVVADAITTPLQAIENVGLAAGQLAIVIGCGGVGTYTALLAAASGAHVAALDISEEKLAALGRLGIRHTLHTAGRSFKEIKEWFKTTGAAEGWPAFGTRIFETSGSRPGQELAFGLMGPAAQVAIVGFTLDKVEVRLSNLMAFDARLIGNWGASAQIYPAAIDLALSGALHLEQTTELVPMEQLADTVERVHHQPVTRRIVFTP